MRVSADPFGVQACGGCEGNNCHRRRTAICVGRIIPPSLGVFIYIYGHPTPRAPLTFAHLRPAGRFRNTWGAQFDIAQLSPLAQLSPDEQGCIGQTSLPFFFPPGRAGGKS